MNILAALPLFKYVIKLITAMEDNKRKEKEIKQLRLRIRKLEKFYKENLQK